MHEIYIARITPGGEPAVVLVTAYVEKVHLKGVVGELLCRFPDPHPSKVVREFRMHERNNIHWKPLTETLMLDYVSARAEEAVGQHIMAHFAKEAPFPERGRLQPGTRYLELKKMEMEDAVAWAISGTRDNELKERLRDIALMPLIQVSDTRDLSQG